MGVENFIWGEDCILAPHDPYATVVAELKSASWDRFEREIPLSEKYRIHPIYCEERSD